MVVAISNIKIFSFRFVFLELNALVVAATRPWTAQRQFAITVCDLLRVDRRRRSGGSRGEPSVRWV